MSLVLENREPRAEDRAARPWASALLGWSVAGLLFVAALALRLRMLDYQPLWLDEGTTWATVTQSRFGTLLLGLLRPTDAYPLYHVLLKPVLRALGDSEYALRLPSAVAGALAVPAMLALGRELRGWALGLASSLLLLLAPWAIQQSQDAKAYSLVLLAAIVLALTFARALRLNTRGAWVLFACVALLAPFVHRLLVFTLLGCAVAWAALEYGKQRAGDGETGRQRDRETGRQGDGETAGRPDNLKHETWNMKLPVMIMILAVAAGFALVAALGVVQDLQRAAGQFAGVGPIRAAWLTFGQWASGQWPGVLRRLYLAPFGVLALLGAARLSLDLRRGRNLRAAVVMLALGGFPALLFGVLLAWRDFYEPRYLTIVYPFWLLLLGYAVPVFEAAAQRRKDDGSRFSVLGSRFSVLGSQFSVLGSWFSVLGSWFLVLCCLYASNSALYAPERGVFSGATLKEDFRGAVRKLAEHVHPDDMVIVHPDTILPLYTYYAPRVASWPLPTPTTYGWLGRAGNDAAQELRALDVTIRQDLGSVPRAWLLIAPEHARVVDAPAEGDLFGLVGLAFEYGDSNGRLMCGTGNAERAYAGFVGVSLYCNNMPSVGGEVPEPEIPVSAVFGGDLRLRGYSVAPFEGGLRAGGPLPLSLYWEPLRSLADTDYIVFIHLTRPDDPAPLVQIDGRPMEGGLPTNKWTEPLAQLHDDRSLMLRDADGRALEPGRYVLRLGVYRAADGSRLAVGATDAETLDDAIVLGEVEVLPAAGAGGR